MLSTKDLSLSYGSKVILDKANLTLLKQEKIALVGQNGEGKSTLLKLLAGHLEPDDGSIKLASKATIGFLEQEPKFNPNASIIDVVSSGLNKQEFEEQKYKIDRILSKLKIHHAQDTLVRILSGGEKRRVDLASILISEPDVYLLDEPTNHLDFESISYLENFLKSTHAPILFISHDKTFIDNTANKILELDKSKFYSYVPPYQNYLENKLVRQDISSKTQHRKEQLLKTELAWLKAGVKARTTKQNAHIGRVYDLQDSVEFGKSFNQNKQVDIKIAKSSRLQKTILELDGIGFGYDSENTLFSNLTLKFKQGDRIGLIGPNGSGKTSLLKIILQKLKPTLGELKYGHKTKFATFEQDRKSLDPEQSLKDFLVDQGDTVFVGDRPIHIASYLERYLFDGADMNRKIQTLSGGEQNRLLLAKLFTKSANFLIFDEPTNDLDLTSLGILEEAILNFSKNGGACIVVSHDKSFLDKICTSVLVFENQDITQYAGNYSYYLENKSNQISQQETKTPKNIQENKKTKTKSKKKTYKEELEYKNIEQIILGKEQELENLQSKISDSDFFERNKANHQEIQSITKQIESLESEIPKLYDRWQELEAI